MKKTIAMTSALLLSNCASIPGSGLDGDRNRDGSVSRAEVRSAQAKYQAGHIARQDETERMNHVSDMLTGARRIGDMLHFR